MQEAVVVVVVEDASKGWRQMGHASLGDGRGEEEVEEEEVEVEVVVEGEGVDSSSVIWSEAAAVVVTRAPRRQDRSTRRR